MPHGRSEQKLLYVNISQSCRALPALSEHIHKHMRGARGRYGVTEMESRWRET